eukprot:scaffold11328_cov97-Skeletonema_menzelii.AAC.1
MSSSQRLTQILLLLNVVVVSISLWSFLNAADGGVSRVKLVEEKSFAPPDTPSSIDEPSPTIAVDSITSGGIGTTNSNGFYFVQPRQGERSFFETAEKTGTDKVTAPMRLPDCLKNDASCTRPG